MTQLVISTIITFVVSSLLGYCVSILKSTKNQLKEKKQNENMQNVALRSLLKGQLTNTYFVYNEIKEIPDYVYANFLDMLNVYESLGGNGFIHTLATKMKEWEIKKTDVL